MAAIKEDFVSFETAKLLKEKGFDEKCLCYYEDNTSYNEGIKFSNWFGKKYSNSEIGRRFCAPTQQMAMKWLREVHNIKINVFYNNLNYAIEYFESNTQTGVDESVFIGDGYKSFEQACEAAIKYCLENLI